MTAAELSLDAAASPAARGRALAPHGSRWLPRLTALTATSTLFLIFAGGMVTSTDSGLAVPDWPLSYGMLMPPMVGGIFYEHGHRMVATFVGLLTLIQTAWILQVEPRGWLRKLAGVSLVAVILQGLLGGLTVLYLLPTPISVTHACLAQAFFCMTLWIAMATSPRWVCPVPAPISGRASRWALLGAGMIYVQLILGALMRHTGAGLAIPDFPWMHGGWLPDFALPGVLAHFAHRVGAAAVTGTLLVVLPKLWSASTDHPALRRGALLAGALLAVQLTLGAFTVWTEKAPLTTSLHVVTGAALLGAMVLLALEAYRVAGAERSGG